MSENINITYDLLFDVLRYEKSREELQTLDENFFEHVADYLKTKDAVLLNVHTTASERELTRIQINNVKKLLTELYERREKKIISLAMYKVKTESELINTTALLKEERFLFNALVEILTKYRKDILDTLLDAKIPNPESIVRDTIIVKDIAEDIRNEKPIKSIRFVKPVPKFLGPELETYGPFEEEEIASLPSIIANILIGKGRAEEIKIE